MICLGFKSVYSWQKLCRGITCNTTLENANFKGILYLILAHLDKHAVLYFWLCECSFQCISLPFLQNVEVNTCKSRFSKSLKIYAQESQMWDSKTPTLVSTYRRYITAQIISLLGPSFYLSMHVKCWTHGHARTHVHRQTHKQWVLWQGKNKKRRHRYSLTHCASTIWLPVQWVVCSALCVGYHTISTSLDTFRILRNEYINSV